MSFTKKLHEFSNRAVSLKDSLFTEEATKTALIMPFFYLLGYDVFNPIEFVPEFVADHGIKKGEKVDYAIIKDNKPVILIEAKSVYENLDKHTGQLHRYFTTTESKFAILTNGIEYRFYTDLEKANILDTTPFLTVNLDNLDDKSIDFLNRFSKKNFNELELIDTISNNQDYDCVYKSIDKLINQVPDEFVQLVLDNFYEGRKTSAIISKFRPIIQDVLNNKFNSDYTFDDSYNEISIDKTTKDNIEIHNDNIKEETSKKSERELLDLEIQAYDLVLDMLSKYTDVDNICQRVAGRYLGVLYTNNVRKWIIRFHFHGASLFISLNNAPKDGTKYKISCIDDINGFELDIVKVLNNISN